MKKNSHTRQRRKAFCLRERAYQALAGQVEVELVFNTPERVSSWSSRWSGTALSQYNLEDMFWRRSGRFPSLTVLDRDELDGEPL